MRDQPVNDPSAGFTPVPAAQAGDWQPDRFASGPDDPTSRVAEFFSWAVILTIVSLMFALNWLEQNQPVEHDPDRSPQAMSEVRGVEFQVRSAMAMRDLMPEPDGQPGEAGPEQNNSGSSPSDWIEGNDGPLWQRYAATAGIAELADPEAALKNLATVDEAVQKSGFQPDPQQVAVRDSLGRVLEEQRDSRGNWTADEKDATVLHQRLGWLGELVTTPRPAGSREIRPGIDDRAQNLVTILVVAMFLMAGLFVASIVAFALATWMFAKGRLQPAMVDQAGSRSVYIETFALWMVLFLLVPGFLMAALGTTSMGVGLAGQILSLAALAWPRIRGRSAAQVMSEVGLDFRNPLREIACGLFGYLCTLVLLGVSLLLLVPIMAFASGAGSSSLESRPPLHPIQDRLLSGDPQAIVMVFLMASVVAPILEEIMFRGVLFRYLRDRTGGFSRIGSVLLSLLASGLIFALIHPQNLVGLLPLTILATGMALLRQWRSSLLASMTMHAVNNGLATTAMLISLS